MNANMCLLGGFLFHNTLMLCGLYPCLSVRGCEAPCVQTVLALALLAAGAGAAHRAAVLPNPAPAIVQGRAATCGLN